MSGEPHTGPIDAHVCELEPLDGDEFATVHSKGQCTICGTVTTPARGVKNAKRQRMW